jgi:hypothetical protein
MKMFSELSKGRPPSSADAQNLHTLGPRCRQSPSQPTCHFGSNMLHIFLFFLRNLIPLFGLIVVKVL